jgi:hypothetical protein
MQNKPIQKIIFGSPGTGKSYRIKTKLSKQLEIDVNSQNYISTVFHPEYTYGDFVGKLVPYTKAGKVEYNFYNGHFIKALGRAYKNLIEPKIRLQKEKKEVLERFKKEIGKSKQDDFTPEEKVSLEYKYKEIKKTPDNVLLVIDEINRGNSASIFGVVFQLLDRDKNNWSEYPISISEIEKLGLLKEIGLESYLKESSSSMKYEYESKSISNSEYIKYQSWIFEDLADEEMIDLEQNQIKIPSNFSIVATMNTSDNSIYFMDNAFKRRWDWEFINVDDDNQGEIVKDRKIVIEDNEYNWVEFVDNLNSFIRSKYKEIRKIEDKQIGYFFINEEIITEEHIKNKLLFFVWDSVFTNNKKPLVKELELSDDNLVTFGQFALQAKNFVDKIMKVE